MSVRRLFLTFIPFSHLLVSVHMSQENVQVIQASAKDFSGENHLGITIAQEHHLSRKYV